ncbi:MAG TPA: hypothetical protein VGB94_05175 [Acidobacteriaceae bacterium]
MLDNDKKNGAWLLPPENISDLFFGMTDVRWLPVISRSLFAVPEEQGTMIDQRGSVKPAHKITQLKVCNVETKQDIG